MIQRELLEPCSPVIWEADNCVPTIGWTRRSDRCSWKEGALTLPNPIRKEILQKQELWNQINPWLLQNTHGDIKHSIGDIVNNVVITLHGCLTTMLYTWNQYKIILYVNYNLKKLKVNTQVHILVLPLPSLVTLGETFSLWSPAILSGALWARREP